MLQRKIDDRAHARALAQIRFHQSSYVLGDHISLDVNPASRTKFAKRGVTQSVFDERNLQSARLQIVDSEAYAIHGD